MRAERVGSDTLLSQIVKMVVRRSAQSDYPAAGGSSLLGTLFRLFSSPRLSPLRCGFRRP